MTVNCCTTEGTNRFFSRWSKTYAKRFRKKGLAKEQRFLVEGIERATPASKTVLEIGSGIGALHMTLLERGARSAVAVDLAEGMLEKARQLAKEKGLESRTRYILGDFVTLNGDISPADITVLDKVVCCYQNIGALMQKSLAGTKEIYALTFPRDTFPIRSLFLTQRFIANLFRLSFSPHWHDWEEMCRTIESSGFSEVYGNKTIAWTVKVYRRK
jgi:SAM-dependent methyltransferase